MARTSQTVKATDRRALDDIADAVRELREKGWSLLAFAKSVGVSTASAAHTCDTTNTRQH